MIKNLIIAALAVAFIVGFGIIEVNMLSGEFAELNSETMVMMFNAENNSLSPDEMDAFTEKWVALREKAEILLPHIDVYECNLRISECRGFVEVSDFENAYVQLSVVEELTRYVPHLMSPTWVHII